MREARLAEMELALAAATDEAELALEAAAPVRDPMLAETELAL